MQHEQKINTHKKRAEDTEYNDPKVKDATKKRIDCMKETLNFPLQEKIHALLKQELISPFLFQSFIAYEKERLKQFEERID